MIQTNTDISYLLNINVKNSFRMKMGKRHEGRIQRMEKAIAEFPRGKLILKHSHGKHTTTYVN